MAARSASADVSSDLPIDSFRGDHWFLSNFSLSPIQWMGWDCATVEHAFQLAKTLDGQEQRRVACAESPALAKEMGRQVSLRADWDDVKDDVMSAILFLKFATHHDLKVKLLSTGSRPLIEGNTWGDRYWGVCDGEGQNKLGLLLMETRSRFMALEGTLLRTSS